MRAPRHRVLRSAGRSFDTAEVRFGHAKELQSAAQANPGGIANRAVSAAPEPCSFEAQDSEATSVDYGFGPAAAATRPATGS